MSNNVETLLRDILDISEREAARITGESQPSINRWKRGEGDPSAKFARMLGVRYDYLVGESSVVWSDKVVALRRSLKAYLAKAAPDAGTTSRRFRVVVAWLAEHGPAMTNGAVGTERYVAAILRMIDKRGDVGVFTDVVNSVIPPSDMAVKRLAEWCEIPVAWFVTGDASLLAEDEMDAVIAKAKSVGVTASDLDAMIDALAKMRSVR